MVMVEMVAIILQTYFLTLALEMVQHTSTAMVSFLMEHRELQEQVAVVDREARFLMAKMVQQVLFGHKHQMVKPQDPVVVVAAVIVVI